MGLLLSLHSKLRDLYEGGVKGAEQWGKLEVVDKSRKTPLSRQKRVDTHMNSQRLWYHAEDKPKKAPEEEGEGGTESHP